MLQHRLFCIVFSGLLALFLTGYACAAASVNYDKAKDRLSVEAQNVSLRQVLGSISLQTGLEILMAPQVEKNVTVKIGKKTLEKAINEIVRSQGLNHALIYKKGKKGKSLLVQVKILPQGVADSAGLLPVVAPEQEVVARSRDVAKNKDRGKGGADHARVRWKSRLEQLPPDKRQHLEELNQRLEEKQLARDEEEKVKDAKREKRRAEREQQRQERENELRKADPVAYDQRMQQREEKRKQYLQSLQNQK